MNGKGRRNRLTATTDQSQPQQQQQARYVQDAVMSHHLALVRRLKDIPEREFYSLLNTAPILAPGQQMSSNLLACLHDIARYRKQGIGVDPQITIKGLRQLSVSSPVLEIEIDHPRYSVLSVAGNVKTDPAAIDIMVTKSGTASSRIQSLVPLINRHLADSRMSNILLIRRLIYVRWVQKYGQAAAKTIAQSILQQPQQPSKTVKQQTSAAVVKKAGQKYANSNLAPVETYGRIRITPIDRIPVPMLEHYQELVAITNSLIDRILIAGRYTTSLIAPKIITGLARAKVKGLIDLTVSGLATIRIPKLLAIRLPLERAVKELRRLLDATKIETIR
jgi:hypothetical protein